MFELLIKSGAAIDGQYFKKQTVLHTACKSNHHRIVKAILSDKKGIVLINDKGNELNHTPLTSAIQFDGDLSLVKLLISNGADKHIKGGDNKTPLEWAMEKAKADIIDYLSKC